MKGIGEALKAVDIVASYAREIGCAVQSNVPMSGYTTFKVGGPAELMITPRNDDELSKIMKKCADAGISPFILGNGSNLVVSDEGLEGVTIFMGARDSLALEGDEEISCAAGVSVSRLCGFALENNLSGLEFAYGIPGSVGGALYMNAGAYGGEFSHVVTGCEYVGSDGAPKFMKVGDMALSYRRSVFAENGGVITKVFIKLCRGDGDEIRRRMNATLEKRRQKQPLQYPSAGSVFKRPEGCFAGALIEQCGLKGKSIGGAQVSEKHAGFIINTGGATASDVLALIELVKKTVFESTGVLLEQEIKTVGRRREE